MVQRYLISCWHMNEYEVSGDVKLYASHDESLHFILLPASTAVSPTVRIHW